jgi:hypothetical protein
MNVVTGKVVEGRVVVEDVELPEGAVVDVYYGDNDDEPYELTEEEDAELEAASLDIRAGNYITAEELFRSLRDQE